MKKYTIEITKTSIKGGGCTLNLKEKGKIDDDIAKMVINHLLKQIKDSKIQVF